MSTYQEYPKVVYKEGQEDGILVKDAGEEADVLGKSETEVQAQADKNAADNQDVVDTANDRELARIREKGQAVSEADMVKLTDAAQTVVASNIADDSTDDTTTKRKPGRPKKVSDAVVNDPAPVLAVETPAQEQ